MGAETRSELTKSSCAGMTLAGTSSMEHVEHNTPFLKGSYENMNLILIAQRKYSSGYVEQHQSASSH